MSQYEISFKVKESGENWFGYALRTDPEGGEHLFVKKYVDIIIDSPFENTNVSKIIGPFRAKDADEAKKIYTKRVVDKYYTIK